MNNRWSTPQEFYSKLNDEFKFELDICAEPWNHKCKDYFTPEDDGLSQDWSGKTCWMNPPYGRELKHWVEKAFNESQKGATVVSLVPSRTETAWFQDYCLKGEVRFVRGRIYFTDVDGKTGRPRFGSAVVIFRKDSIVLNHTIKIF